MTDPLPSRLIDHPSPSRINMTPRDANTHFLPVDDPLIHQLYIKINHLRTDIRTLAETMDYVNGWIETTDNNIASLFAMVTQLSTDFEDLRKWFQPCDDSHAVMLRSAKDVLSIGYPCVRPTVHRPLALRPALQNGASDKTSLCKPSSVTDSRQHYFTWVGNIGPMTSSNTRIIRLACIVNRVPRQWPPCDGEDGRADGRSVRRTDGRCDKGALR